MMPPHQRRSTAEDLRIKAGELKARALRARAAARRSGDPTQVKRLKRQADQDLREAGLSERAALGLETEAGDLSPYEQLLAFQREREKRIELPGPTRDEIEPPRAKEPPVRASVKHHPLLALYPHLRARVEGRDFGEGRTH